MEVKQIEVELLLKGAERNVKYILTHTGFINNTGMSAGELSLLGDLSKRLEETDTAIVVGDFVFSAYITGYNNGNTLAGIKINKAIKCQHL